MSFFRVEPVEISDIPKVSYIHAAVWREAYSFMPKCVLNARNAKAREKQWRDWFQSKHRFDDFRKLCVREKIVGFSFCKENEDPDLKEACGEMHAAYILPEYRGGAAGPYLMLGMAQSLLGNRLAPFSLWAFKQNSMRIAYGHLGWTPVVERDRKINGVPLPEVGYIHRDPLKLMDRLQRVINRYEP